MRQKQLQKKPPKAGAHDYRKKRPQKASKGDKGSGKDSGSKPRNAKSVSFADHDDDVPQSHPQADKASHWIGAVSSSAVGSTVDRSGVGFFEWRPHSCCMLCHHACPTVSMSDGEPLEGAAIDDNMSDTGSSISSVYDRLESPTIPRSLIARPHVVSVEHLRSIYMTYAASDLGMFVLWPVSNIYEPTSVRS